MARLSFLVRSPSPAGSSSAAADLAQWRGQILQVTLVATAFLAAIAYFPGVVAAAQAELWLLVVADTVAWALVIGLALARGLPYAVRAIFFAACWYLLALLLLFTTGPGGGGVTWLLSFPVLLSIFVGLRGAMVGLGITLLTLVGFGTLIHRDAVGLREGLPGGDYELVAWMGTSGSLFFLAMVLSLSISYLVRGMERSLAQVHASRGELAEAKESLESEMEERSELEAQLLQSQKMEALGTLAGGIAHDFNNLLVPILLQSQELLDQAPAGSPEREDLDSIVRSASRARDLVRRILTFSRKSREDRFPVELEPVVREVGTLLRSTIPANIRIELDLQAEGARILADPGELHQILMNLATNAYRAMEEGGGTLTLATSRDPEEGEVLLRVEDEGVGIEPEVRERAFDPFFSTRPPGEGTGLGLAIVHGIVTGLGGSIRLESEPGEGTRVELRFPVAKGANVPRRPPAEEPSQASPPPVAPASHPDGSGEVTSATILVVDDEEMVRRTSCMVLTRLGFQVREATSPESALRQLEESPEDFDLLLTDQAMPGMTGLELARHARRVRPDLPVVLVSGYLDEKTREGLRKLKVEGVLQKPFGRDDLKEVLESALREGKSFLEDGSEPPPPTVPPR